ncbi:hypothetical protein QFZ58_000506 [Streptomyces sp. B1I3]|nr:hypothetical protein [Streptomyces sp. B1I3]
MTPSIAPTSAPQSPADVEAHDLASHIRRTVVPTQDSPKPPSEPAARRRFIAQRGW